MNIYTLEVFIISGPTTKAFGYWFDFGDDWWHQTNVISIENKISKSKYPRITNRIGPSPPPYVDFDE
jgi:hypothetical protein